MSSIGLGFSPRYSFLMHAKNFINENQPIPSWLIEELRKELYINIDSFDIDSFDIHIYIYSITILMDEVKFKYPDKISNVLKRNPELINYCL